MKIPVSLYTSGYGRLSTEDRKGAENQKCNIEKGIIITNQEKLYFHKTPLSGIREIKWDGFCERMGIGDAAIVGIGGRELD